MRFLVSGPVSSIFCLPTRPSADRSVGVVLVGRPAVQHAARAELLRELREVLCGRVVGHLRLLFGIEVVEVAEELVEAMHGRQEFVAIAEMVLAELPGGVAVRLQSSAMVGSSALHAHRRAGNADLGQAGAEAALPRDERRAARGAALLAIGIGEEHALLGDAVDVGRAVAHQPVAVATEVA